MQYKTDYAGHDELYRRKRAEGKPGWDDGEQWLAWKAEIDGLMDDPGFPKTGALLELGCGAGDASLLFAEKGYQVSGIEISPAAVEWAREKFEGRDQKAELVVGGVTDLGRWGDGTFDIVIDGHCLHCIIGGDRGKVLSETYRVLKPGGLFYVSTMCGDPKEEVVVKAYDPESRCMVVGGVARRYFGRPGDIIGEVERAGFKIEKQQIGFNPDGTDDLLAWARK
jgi:ubiquinone/menaquinone biosynthesis C-methylase UbiE